MPCFTAEKNEIYVQHAFNAEEKPVGNHLLNGYHEGLLGAVPLMNSMAVFGVVTLCRIFYSYRLLEILCSRQGQCC